MLPEIQVLRDAGLRPTHVARILDISRAAVSDWYRGGNPHRWILEKVRDLASAVSAAIDAGKLPVSGPDAGPRTQLIAHRFYLDHVNKTRSPSKGVSIFIKEGEPA